MSERSERINELSQPDPPGVREMLVHLVRRWWLAAALVGLGALSGLIYAVVSPPVYSARAYVVVVAQNPADTGAVSYAQAYSRIAVQGDVLGRAAGGGAAPTELRRQVRTSSSPDAPVIEVVGSARTAERAAALSNLVANSLVDTANERASDTRMRLSLLSPASPPAEPASPRLGLDVAVGAAAGLLLGGLAVLVGAGGTSPGGARPSNERPREGDPR